MTGRLTSGPGDVAARSHRALIHWSDGQIAHGLPDVPRTVTPAWFPDEGEPPADGWSLICDFDGPPRVQGSPTPARVRFLMDAAPHARLAPGAVLRLLERATLRCARVEILD